MSKTLALGLIAAMVIVAFIAFLARGLTRARRSGLPKGIVRERNVRDSAERNMAKVALDGVEGKVEKSSVKKVTGIVDEHPEEVVSVVRRWMRE